MQVSGEHPSRSGDRCRDAEARIVYRDGSRQSMKPPPGNGEAPGAARIQRTDVELHGYLTFRPSQKLFAAVL